MAADADAPDGELSTPDTADSEAADVAGLESDPASDEQPATRRVSPVLAAMLLGIFVVLSLGGVSGWLGLRAYHSHRDLEQRELFLRVGRQGALNLTTIDWEHVDGDIQRILDSATGPFYDDFLQRSQPFVDVVKKVQSKSVGTINEAGLESVSGDEARVLVAVSVKTSNLGEAEQPPRSWRMRIDVQKVDDGAKVSNVLFVPA